MVVDNNFDTKYEFFTNIQILVCSFANWRISYFRKLPSKRTEFGLCFRIFVLFRIS